MSGRKGGLAILVPDNKYANVTNKVTAAIMFAFTLYSTHLLQSITVQHHKNIFKKTTPI
jgi:hypothetical protein